MKNIDTREHKRTAWPARVWNFYAEGFRSMTVGRYLWAIIIVKLVIFFLVFKLFFFPNVLSENYDTDEERAEAVMENLTGSKQ